MNSAKKTLKNQDKPVRVGNTGDKKNPVVFIIIIALVSIILIGGVAVENFKPRNALTIDGKKISLDKMMYNIWTTETQYNYMDQMYQSYYHTSYWSMTADADTGATYADQAKDEVMNLEIQCNLLYKEALDKGYKLTEDEKKEVDEEFNDILKMYSFWNRMRLGFSKSYLREQITRAKIVSRYREDLIEGFDVDDDKIKAGIDKKDYKEYELGFYYADIEEFDDEGNSKDLSQKEIDSLKEEMQKLRDEADKAEDFSKLLPEDEEKEEEADSQDDESDEEDSPIKYETESFIEKDGWDYASDKNLASIKAMKKDEISDVIVDKETKYIYFVKLIDNTSTDSYDKAVEDAITEAESTAFDEYYEKLKEKHKIKVIDKVWSTIQMGKVTTAIEREEVSEDSTGEDSGDDSEDAESGDSEDAEGGEETTDENDEDTEGAEQDGDDAGDSGSGSESEEKTEDAGTETTEGDSGKQE